jgi:hypothetical protein
MNDFLVAHSDKLIPAVAVVALLWLAGRWVGRSKVAHGDRIPLRVYCKHCNWEGTVRRTSMACQRCRSQDLQVLAA